MMRKGSQKIHYGNYEVGKGRPPKITRWKAGQSGNPKGRPKGAKSLATIFQEALNRPLEIEERGRTRKITAREAIVLKVVHQALKGDFKAILFLLNSPEMTRTAAPIRTITPGMTLEEAQEVFRQLVHGDDPQA